MTTGHHDASGPNGDLRIYLAVFGALMGLTAATVWIAFYDLGGFNDVAALAIAGTKASLVVLYFMHVIHAGPLVKLAVAAGFLWLFILFAFTLSDFWTRGLFI